MSQKQDTETFMGQGRSEECTEMPNTYSTDFQSDQGHLPVNPLPVFIK